MKASENPYPSILVAEQAVAPSTPATGYGRIYCKADGLYFIGDDGVEVGPLGANSGSGVDTYAPWLVDILPTVSDPAAVVGTWAPAYYTSENQGGPYLSANSSAVGVAGMANNGSGAQNDSISWDVVLSAGTWNVTIWVRKSTNTGIITLKIDGVSIGTVDTYAASLTYVKVSITGFSIAASGKKRITIQAATKNASSAGYYLTLFSMSLRRTA